MRSFKLPICALLLVAAGACDRTTQQAAAEKEEAAPQNIVYGINADNYRTETGEVGSGETLGCGTGACAALVASVLCGLSDRTAQVRLPGGNLELMWNPEDNCVYQSGPAEFVFDGVWFEQE